MASMNWIGVDEIIHAFDATADDISDCSEEICTKGAEIIRNEQVKTGEAMGVHRTGTTLNSLSVKGFVKTRDGGFCKVTFDGRNDDGNENSEVAFINEYGKTNQPARPFIATANETSEAATIKVAVDVLDRHLKKHNL